MADTLDLLSLADAKRAINRDQNNVDDDADLARHVTLVSRLIDAACGPVVQRTITAEMHDGGTNTIRLRHRPVSSISQVREARSGTVYVLSAATFGSSTDGYFAPTWTKDPGLKSGVLHRRRYTRDWCWEPGENTVEVTYTAGRVANTAAVDEQFADCAAACLRRLWKREAGAWSQSPAFFADNDSDVGSGFYRIAQPIIDEMLWDEKTTPLIGVK